MKLHERLDSILAAATAAGKVPGVVAAVATDDGVVYQGAHGVRALGRPEPMTNDTMFWIASMTKAITSAAALRLVARGALALDEPLGGRVPHLARVQVLEGFDSEGRPRLRAPSKPVTLRHLLTHTSGFVYNVWNATMARYQAARPAADPTTFAAYEMPLVFDPGERWDYGIGIDWAGVAIETVTGQRLGAHLEEHFFGPLGMASTRFTLSADQLPRRASTHVRAPTGLTPVPLPPSVAPALDTGGGGLYSTVPDYLRFVRMILAGGRSNGVTILAPQTIALLRENQIGSLDVAPMRSGFPHVSNDCDFFPGIKAKWSLGFLINTERSAEGRSAGSLAWAGLPNCFYWIDPTKRVTGVLATQIMPFCDVDALTLFRELERAVYASLS